MYRIYCAILIKHNGSECPVRFLNNRKSYLRQQERDLRKEVSGNEFAVNTIQTGKSPKWIFTRRAMGRRDDGESALIFPRQRTDTFATNFGRRREDKETKRRGAPCTLVNPARHVPRTHAGIANFLAAVTHCIAQPLLLPALPSLLRRHVYPSCVRVVLMMK